jgi:prepilin-type N-terminal cleavage/methylation domain-containing protein
VVRHQRNPVPLFPSLTRNAGRLSWAHPKFGLQNRWTVLAALQLVKSFLALQADGKNAADQPAFLSFNLMPGANMDRSGQSRFAQHRRAASSAFPARQAGFTLVEMAVVLVIIGVILGAVMIGRDAQRNATQSI